MSNLKSDIQYLISKYGAIPEGEIVSGIIENEKGKCTVKWAGINDYTEQTEESLMLKRVFDILPVNRLDGTALPDNYEFYPYKAEVVNDGFTQYQQSTPKLRVMAYLYDANKIIQNKSVEA